MMTTKPNVILLTVDTLRADMVGCHGRTSLTPNLDSLAASGVRFDQAITGGSWTQAAFPVILTSTYASMYGGCLGPLAPTRPSPVDSLATHGYTTAGFSTSPLLSRNYRYDRGFRDFFDLSPEETDPALRSMRGGQRLLRKPLTHYVSSLLGTDTRPARLYISADELTGHVCNWLGNARQPFFLWAHYMDIHWPYHLQEQLQHPQDIAQVWRELGHLNRVNWQGETITAEQRERYVWLYEQAIAYTDQQLGRLIAHLEALDLFDNTVVIVVSDHGEEFLERGRWGHFESNLYDEILKVPFIIRLPDRSDALVVSQQIRTLDIMPTILDLCSCPFPQGMEGASLAPLWGKGDGAYDAAESLSEMWRQDRHIIAVRTEDYKYIWNSRSPETPQLFDLQTDPGERQNIVAEQAEVARYFQSRVDAHLRRASEGQSTDRGAAPQLDEEVLRRLRGLGYLE